MKKIIDIWNSFLIKGAKLLVYDIPLCPNTNKIPKKIIRYDEAVTIYNREIKKGNTNFKSDSWICFYMNDSKFDGPGGIWSNPYKLLEIVRHFGGIITPDFSTYADFPIALKIYNTYRMRAIGCWLYKEGINVINNVRWGDFNTYFFSFIGIPLHSVLAIGTIGGNPHFLENRERFIKGFYKMIQVLKPCAIIIYGKADYVCFDITKVTRLGIEVYVYDSETNEYYKDLEAHVKR